jgi:hypothetical protein
MTRRGLIAAGILVAWVAGVGAYARRELQRSPTARLAEAALRVQPGATYFQVERDGKHVGFASVTIDTVTAGLQVTDYTVLGTDTSAGDGRTTAKTVIRLSRALVLQDFVVSREDGLRTTAVRGEVVANDSTLRWTRAAPGTPDVSRRVPVHAPLFLPTLVPLTIALGERLRIGRTYTVNTFDPATTRIGPAAVRVRAESLFTVADSAVFDSTRSRWIPAHTDTVRAWLLQSERGTLLDGWVDAAGRMVSSRTTEGLLLRRTAYEIAFENWRSNAGKKR